MSALLVVACVAVPLACWCLYEAALPRWRMRGQYRDQRMAYRLGAIDGRVAYGQQRWPLPEDPGTQCPPFDPTLEGRRREHNAAYVTQWCFERGRFDGWCRARDEEFARMEAEIVKEGWA